MMASKRHKRMEMDLAGKWLRYSVLLMAISLFLCISYYFGIKNMVDLGFGRAFFGGILPLAISVAFVVLAYILKWNAPGTYGLLAVAYFAMLIISGFFSGDVFRMILGAVWYAAAACVMLLTSGGHLQSRKLLIAILAAAIIGRVVLFDVGRIGIFEWVSEGSVVFTLGAFLCLPMSFYYPKK